MYEFADIAGGCVKKLRRSPRQVRDLHGTRLSVYVAIPGIGVDYFSPGGVGGRRHLDMDYFHFVGNGAWARSGVERHGNRAARA